MTIPFEEEFREGYEGLNPTVVGETRLIPGSVGNTRQEVLDQRDDFLQTLKVVVLHAISVGDFLDLNRAEAESVLDELAGLDQISDVISTARETFGTTLVLKSTSPHTGGRGALTVEQLEEYAASPYNYGRFETLATRDNLQSTEGSDPESIANSMRANAEAAAQQNGWTFVREEGDNLIYRDADGAAWMLNITDPRNAWVPAPPELQRDFTYQDDRLGLTHVGFDEEGNPVYRGFSEDAAQRRIREAERLLARFGEFADPDMMRVEGEYAGRDTLAPRYSPGEEITIGRGQPPDYIAEVNQALYEAGLLTQEEASFFFWGPMQQEAMSVLMGEANQMGVTWQDMAARRATAWSRAQEITGAGGGGSTGGSFTRPVDVYRAPDYSYLADQARMAFAQEIGRMPEDYELALLADQLDQDYRRQFDADVAAQDLGYAAIDDQRSDRVSGPEPAPFSAIALESGATPPGGATPADQQPGERDTSTLVAGTVETVDPMARLRQTLQNRYAQEIENTETRTQGRVSMNVLMSNLARGGQWVG